MRVVPVARRRRIGALERQRRRLAVPFLLPALCVYGIFMIYPAATTFYIALTKWNGVTAPTWTGLDNFQRLTTDSAFGETLSHAVWFTVLGAAVLFPGAIFFAYVTQKIRFGRMYRFLILAPIALSVSTAALLWKLMLDVNFGAAPAFLRSLGLDRLGDLELLGNPSTALFVVVLATVWHGVGMWTMFFVAAIERVPPELLEAAALDGASAWGTFRHVVWPLIWDVTKTLLVLWVIQALQAFAFIIAMTNGGPLRSTEVIGTYIYKMAFTSREFGYAAAIAVVLFVAIVVLTTTSLAMSRRQKEAV